MHGIHYLIQQGLVIFESGTRKPLQITPSELMIEAVFELIRKSEFPHLPSRMQSMFAWCNVNDAKEFSIHSDGTYPIFELESENVFIADQNLLYLGGSIIGTYEIARKYWSVQRSDNYKLEAVIPLPVALGNSI